MMVVWVVWRRRNGRGFRTLFGSTVLWLRPLEWVAVYFVLYAAAVIALTMDTMWVPTEIVALDQEGQRTYVVGNVLTDDGRWVTVLRSDDHGLSRYPANEVTARTLCHMAGNQPRHRSPLIDVVLDQRHVSPNRQCWAVLQRAGVTQAQIVTGSLSSDMLAQLP
jgi:hypothetical protein